ncbi:MAG: hypothetical protein ACRDSJ_06460 [Rubrobacteraceae bacterium]
MKGIISKVMLVSLAVAITAMVGATSVAVAAKGKPFILGKNNAARAVSTLVNQGPGPALKLLVKPGQPPLSVNSDVKVANLNADKVDGLDANGLTRVAFNQRGGNVVVGQNGTMASDEITAPTDGFLVISASANANNSNVFDLAGCEIRVDDVKAVGSDKLVELDGGQNINERQICATNAVAPVSDGTHRVDFEAFGVNASATTFSNPSLWAIFVPFDGEGNQPVQSE